MVSLLGGVFLGWALGANDAANIFGAAVAARMVRFVTAALVAALFVVLGAVLQGQAGIETYQGLTAMTLDQAVTASVAAALTVTGMTLLKLPVSTSQAMVGAILGVGLLAWDVNAGGLGKVVLCWVGTPVGGAVFAIILYALVGAIYNRLRPSMFVADRWLRIGLLVSGAYGAFALGANNVANVTAVFVAAGKLSVLGAVWIGGASIAFGILTLSRPVMLTVGKGLFRLDAFSAFIVVTSQALTVHFYSMIGVPVSTSQAVIGAILGVGIVKGIRTLNRKMLVQILLGWLFTPLVACCLCVLLAVLANLDYVPLR